MRFKYLIVICAALSVCISAMAKDNAEDRHVRAILFSGDTIEGYLRNDLKTGLKNIFSKTGSIHQYINIGVEPKGGETKRYSASEVKEYRFLEPTEGYPEGAAVVSEKINSPLIFKPHSCVRGFAFELDRRESGSILEWKVWEDTGGKNSTRRLVPVVGVKFNGAKAAYCIIHNGSISTALLMHYLKKQSPEFREVLDNYYNKGKDSKAHRKELKDNPSTILLLYENFIKENKPLDDPEANDEPQQEGKK